MISLRPKKNTLGYDPKDVGWDLPGVNKIYIGHCGSRGRHKERPPSTYLNKGLAHTHKCIHDPAYNSICFWEPEFLKSRELVYHEYAHVLDTREMDCRNVDLSILPVDFGHDEPWANIMKGWGFTPSPYIPLSEITINE